MNKFKKSLKLVTVFTLILTILAGCSLSKSNSKNSTPFDYSSAFTDEGFWKDIRALDYVNLCDYKNISVPNNVHDISDDAVQAEITEILNRYSTEEKVRNRPVEFGDTVNIDYVGRVDGIELEGSKSSGKGVDVVVGSTSLFGDLVDQLEGYSPGETATISVVLPNNNDYDQSPDKEAVFEVKINYIINLMMNLLKKTCIQYMAGRP